MRKRKLQRIRRVYVDVQHRWDVEYLNATFKPNELAEYVSYAMQMSEWEQLLMRAQKGKGNE